MVRLTYIYNSIINIEKKLGTIKYRRYKKEKIYELLDYLFCYTENIISDISHNGGINSHPYFNEDKINHTLLEVYIQLRIMNTGKEKGFPEIAAYLLKIRLIAEETMRREKYHKNNDKDHLCQKLNFA